MTAGTSLGRNEVAQTLEGLEQHRESQPCGRRACGLFEEQPFRLGRGVETLQLDVGWTALEAGVRGIAGLQRGGAGGQNLPDFGDTKSAIIKIILLITIAAFID